MFGAIIGDVIGSVYEFNNYRKKDFNLYNDKCELTDDTILTVAVADILKKGYINNRKKIINIFKKYFKRYPSSYGISFSKWANSKESEPYYSFGNGAAMRVSPVAWFAKNEEEVKLFSQKITEVTHDHPEGLKGAEVTAMCVWYARKGKSKEFIKEYVEQYYDLNFNYNDLIENYRFNETCQNTVPQAIYCFLISKDFEDCLRTSVSIGGDTDTLCAISCSIAEAYYKNIDRKLRNFVWNKIPEEFKEIVCQIVLD